MFAASSRYDKFDSESRSLPLTTMLFTVKCLSDDDGAAYGPAGHFSILLHDFFERPTLMI